MDVERRRLYRPVPRDGLLRCASQGCDGDVEYYDGGKLPVWRCTTNKRHRQRLHPNHLRLPKMRDLVIAAVGKRGLAKLERASGVSERQHDTSSIPATAGAAASSNSQGILPGTTDDEETVTAVELARRLHQDPRTLRAWLRSHWRDGHPLLKSQHHLNESWEFTPEEADQLAAEFRRPE